MKKTAKILALILAVTIFSAAAVLPASAFENVIIFPDVPQNAWYADDLYKLTYYGIINGMDDGNFHPNDTVTRGQFIKMIGSATEGLYMTDWSDSKHWSQPYWTALNEAGVLEIIESSGDANNPVQTAYPLVSLSWSELEKPISRYEMAFIINNMLYMVCFENKMKLASDTDSYANHIADYDTMDMSYRAAVEQAYSKGILTGYEDTSFVGSGYLTRAEAATVIYRYLDATARETQSFSVEAEREVIPDPDFVSFAFQYRSMTNEQRRIALFGNANKTYFTSASDAQGYMVSIQVPIWKLNESTGAKYSSTAWLTVHKLVAKEVTAIFNEIYNSPEKFPIKAVGGARFSDTLRHSWGCAIDINPNENYYLSYRTGQRVGTLWLPGENPYSITPNGSVVTAFARYGWGWGGQGWTSGVDYMHFSILSSGG
jgi:hypothetical protein